jgi:hypothetical protein
MEEGLYTENIWEIISDSINKNKSKSFIAVPYFAKNATKKILPKKGSVLVVNASKGVVEAGSTSPEELIKLIKLGVKVYTNDKLHAKIYVAKSSIIVGSANVSDNSSEKLHEAIWYSTNQSQIENGIEFVQKMANPIDELTIEELKKLIPIFCIKPRDSGQMMDKSQHKVRILQMTNHYPSVEYDEAIEVTKKRNIKEIREYQNIKIEDIQWDGHLKSGIFILIAMKENNSMKYYPISTVIDSEAFISKNEKAYAILLKSLKGKRALNKISLAKLFKKEDLRYFKQDNKELPLFVSRVLFKHWGIF